ncbi:MAG TPA: MarP family serine protease [Jatrophihabitantaceae bacterium]|nr:MarP family serine protease [Jatrophihabitantaceae bacterium]
MNLVDVVIVLAAVAYGVAGFRNGFVVGLFSLTGFVLGALIGAQIAQPIGRGLANGIAEVPLAVGILLLCAFLGQLAGVWLGALVRRQITWHPARHVDQGFGALLGVLGALFVAWMVAVPLASAPYPSVAREVRQSSIVHAVDGAMPSPLRKVGDGVRRFVDRSDFPEVLGALGATHIVDVAPPDTGLAATPVVRRVRPSVVKVYSDAPSCGRESEGSGFVYAPGRVMTNAHVVAGGRSVRVVTNAGTWRARVVVYDPRRDVAVLAVPGFTARSLTFAPGSARTGQNAVVLGYPKDGPFDAEPARVRSQQQIRGGDIYGNSGDIRQAYAVRSLVRSGNSGGPLIDTSGRVLGVVFASAIDSADTGFVLTAAEVSPDAKAGRTATATVGTESCT